VRTISPSGFTLLCRPPDDFCNPRVRGVALSDTSRQFSKGLNHTSTPFYNLCNLRDKHLARFLGGRDAPSQGHSAVEGDDLAGDVVAVGDQEADEGLAIAGLAVGVAEAIDLKGQVLHAAAGVEVHLEDDALDIGLGLGDAEDLDAELVVLAKLIFGMLSGKPVLTWELPMLSTGTPWGITLTVQSPFTFTGTISNTTYGFTSDEYGAISGPAVRTEIYGMKVENIASASALLPGDLLTYTLTVANQKGAYTLTDEGTFLAFKSQLNLVPLVTQGTTLLNRYSVIAVNNSVNPSVNLVQADRFINWLISEDGKQFVGDYGVEKYGKSLFTPLTQDVCTGPPSTAPAPASRPC
jgi:hypothetical protein